MTLPALSSPFIFLSSSGVLRDPPSFPTRRSSDLVAGQLIEQGKTDLSHEEATSLIDSVARSAYRSEEHTSELQSRGHLVCRLLLEKKKQNEMVDTMSLDEYDRTQWSHYIAVLYQH